MSSVSGWTIEWAKSKNIPTQYFESIDSTNTLAKDKSQSEPENGAHLIIADHQTAGHGRNQSIWSDLGSGSLLSSWVFEMDRHPQPITTPLVGLALYQSAKQIWPEARWSLKAPNDLYLEKKKVAGILTEVITQGPKNKVVLGIGINVFNHPEEVELAGHISQQVDVDQTKWTSFLNEFWTLLNQAINDSSKSHMSSEACSHLKEVLNAFPHLKEPYKQIGTDGTLETVTGKLNWNDLI